MIHVGTSGYNYPEWKGEGRFYPPRLAASKMLPYYAERFPTVEINYTFYRMPNAELTAGWAAQVPDHFTFTLKAPRRITHDRRLRDSGDAVRAFLTAAAGLGAKLGALLFQLPPNFRKDVPRFDEFLSVLPAGTIAAFEFRHDSWLDEDVYARLRERNLALCIADSETRSTPLLATADYAYFRLRDEGYDETAIAAWADRIQALSGECRESYVYFKHESEGKGPEFGRLLQELLAAS